MKIQEYISMRVTEVTYLAINFLFRMFVLFSLWRHRHWGRDGAINERLVCVFLLLGKK